jgi:hypothetical protein
MIRICLVIFLVVASGCGGSGSCTVNSDCQPGLVCEFSSNTNVGFVTEDVEGQCVVQPR